MYRARAFALVFLFGCLLGQPFAYGNCLSSLFPKSLDFDVYLDAKAYMETSISSARELSMEMKDQFWRAANSPEEKLALIEVFANSELQKLGFDERFELNKENRRQVYRKIRKVMKRDVFTRADLLDILRTYETKQRLQLLEPSSWKRWYLGNATSAGEIVETQWVQQNVAHGVASAFSDVGNVMDVVPQHLLVRAVKFGLRILVSSVPEFGQLKDKVVAGKVDELATVAVRNGTDSAYYMFQSEFANSANRAIAWDRFRKLLNISLMTVFVNTLVTVVDSSSYPKDGLWTTKEAYAEPWMEEARREYLEEYGRPMTTREEEIVLGSFLKLSKFQIREQASKYTD